MSSRGAHVRARKISFLSKGRFHYRGALIKAFTVSKEFYFCDRLVATNGLLIMGDEILEVNNINVFV